MSKGTSQKELQEFFEKRRSTHKATHYTVNALQGETLHCIGSGDHRMLVKVSVAKVGPPKHILERTKQLLETNNSSGRRMYSNPLRDTFWAKRYMLFDKFDLGIKLDE